MSNLKTSIVLNLAGNLESRAARFAGSLDSLANRGQRSMGMLRSSVSSVGKMLDGLGNRYTAAIAGAGAAYKSTQAVMDSAALDKKLVRITQTAGATKQAAIALRKELHLMSQSTGQSLDGLLDGFNNLIQAGLEWDAAFATIQAINSAMAVTGASADVLSAGLTVAGEAFDFDLAKLETSKDLLDQMTVAGRLGNAELEDLAGIFARIGVNAKAANLSFPQTLGFIEQLSLIERNPERLATLADSTLRLFTNQNYLKKAAAVTGVSFYDKDGERRAAFEVLDDIAAKYKTLATGQQRDSFIDAAFGDADLDTKKGLAMLLGGDSLAGVRTMTGQIERATGVISKDLPEAISNSVDQVARLKAALRDAADEFSRPINDTIQEAIQFLLDERKLGGKELLGGGIAAAALGFGVIKGGGKLLSKVGGLGGGLAAGKVLEEVSGVTPVYVVNMPGSFGGSGLPIPGASGKAAGAGAALARRGSRLGRWFGRAGGALGLVAGGVGLATTLMDDSLTTGQKVEQGAGFVGGAAGGWAGAKIGGLIGTAILPGIGTAIGAGIGGLGGYLAGEWGGEKLAGLFKGGDEDALADKIGRAVARNVAQDAGGRLVLEIQGAPATLRSATGRGRDFDVDTGLNMGAY
ncbi:phage tail tape measure protein [Desulfocurvibacter africanus]|uniref:phage tail tape measure protein n=1 Tax=Desulfocurvibacter africanus TaxID=873 RepID=UPI0003F8CDD2|nr:phage tail tape measure protein [Desulfocurvibacter africanus]